MRVKTMKMNQNSWTLIRMRVIFAMNEKQAECYFGHITSLNNLCESAVPKLKGWHSPQWYPFHSPVWRYAALQKAGRQAGIAMSFLQAMVQQFLPSRITIKCPKSTVLVITIFNCNNPSRLQGSSKWATSRKLYQRSHNFHHQGDGWAVLTYPHNGGLPQLASPTKLELGKQVVAVCCH